MSIDALRVMVVIRDPGRHFRFVDPVIEELLARGHRVELLALRKGRASAEDTERLAALGAGSASFQLEMPTRWRRDGWYRTARAVRGALDLVDLLRSDLASRPALVERGVRAAGTWGTWIARVAALRGLRGWPLSALGRMLGRVDAMIPPNRTLVARLRTVATRPDVFLLVPSLMPGLVDTQLARAARRAGVPSIIAVSSWDELAGKQIVHERADALFVWNELLAAEAIERHGWPGDRVCVTGAPCHDEFVTRVPRTREDWCRRTGLDPALPYVLFVGGSLKGSESTEAEYARRWVLALRACAEPAVSRVQVIIRPHPLKAEEWSAVRFDDIEGVVVWPGPGAPFPIAAGSRADYHDSLAHAAVVVGVNSSALIEATVVGRPVHVLEPAEFRASQREQPHFQYLTETPGVVTVVSGIDAHPPVLAEVVTHAGADHAPSLAFGRAFSHPHGTEQRATAVFVDALERVAAAGDRQRSFA